MSLSTGPLPGSINVTFDAGTGRGDVNSNPQYCGTNDSDPSRPKSFSVTWQFVAKNNLATDWMVDFGNVVPCDLRDLYHLQQDYDFVSEPIPPDPTETNDGWRWIFTLKDGHAAPKLKMQEILYDVFFNYRPAGGATSAYRLVSLRQILSVDPSILLPPKQSGGGTLPIETA